MTWGDRLGAPGELTEYSDSGYVILGAIIERFFEGDLGLGLRELLNYEALGLRSTWLEDLEDGLVDKDSMVHRYHGIYETTDWDASVDLFGGGGLASTTGVLAVFFYGLFNGEVYDHEQTLELMLSKPNYIVHNENNQQRDTEWYNYGMWTFEVHGEIVHLHTGFWGTVMLYVPRLQTSISVNTSKGKSDRLIKKTIALLQTLKENQ